MPSNYELIIEEVGGGKKYTTTTFIKDSSKTIMGAKESSINFN